MSNHLNMLKFDNHIAVVAYDPEIEMFRGEFVGLNGSADFYASSVEELKIEGERSLATFLDVCRERGIEPVKKFSGKLHLRLSQATHEKAAIAAAARGVSLNTLIEAAVEHEVAECV